MCLHSRLVSCVCWRGERNTRRRMYSYGEMEHLQQHKTLLICETRGCIRKKKRELLNALAQFEYDNVIV